MPLGIPSPDVRDLKSENLPDGDFPGNRPREFRVYFERDVHAALWAHASENVKVEICGVLVGRWKRDALGPFVHVSDRIRCDSADSQASEVTFTHQAWAQIHREMDSRFADRTIVGWYHSHPDFGIFLSDRDVFIHEHFFNSPGQIALVIDPVRKSEGVFAWRDGAPAVAPQHWVEDSVVLPPKSGDAEQSERRKPSETASLQAPRDRRWPLFDLSIAILAASLMFLLGYFASGFLYAGERRLLLEGLLSHYRTWAALRSALVEDLKTLDSGLKRIQGDFDAIPNRSTPGGQSLDERDRLGAIKQRLDDARQFADKLQERYGTTPQEAAMLAQLREAPAAAADTKTATDRAGPRSSEKDRPTGSDASSGPRN